MLFDKENDQNWLSDSEDDMLVEDALWNEMFDALATAAQIEIEMGLTQPMFDVNGELISDETPYLAGKGIERRAK